MEKTKHIDNYHVRRIYYIYTIIKPTIFKQIKYVHQFIEYIQIRAYAQVVGAGARGSVARNKMKLLESVTLKKNHMHTMCDIAWFFAKQTIH